MAVHNAPLQHKQKHPQLSKEEQCMVDILNAYLCDWPITEELFPEGFNVNDFISVASRHEVLLIICQILAASQAKLDPSVDSKSSHFAPQQDPRRTDAQRIPDHLAEIEPARYHTLVLKGLPLSRGILRDC